MFEWRSEYSVGNEAMDDVHRAFLVLLKMVIAADKTHFCELFATLIEHTEEHFAFENTLLEKHRCASWREHMAEHKQILGEMHHFHEKALNGRQVFARAYAKEKLPHWLRQHTATMDADLSRALH